MELVPTLEIGLLTLGAFTLVWAARSKQRWNTISELFWLFRDRLGHRGRLGLVGALTGALVWLWWHLVFG